MARPIRTPRARRHTEKKTSLTLGVVVAWWILSLTLGVWVQPIARAAGSQDRNRIAAESAYAEAERLRAQESAESLPKAIEKYNEALRYWRIMGDHHGEAATLTGLASVRESLGETQTAADFYSQVLKLQQAMGDRQGEASALHNLGRAHLSMGENKTALEYLDQASPAVGPIWFATLRSVMSPRPAY